jgi:hypothetical protein
VEGLAIKRWKRVPVHTNLKSITVQNVIQARDALVTREAQEEARQVKYDTFVAARELSSRALNRSNSRGR